MRAAGAQQAGQGRLRPRHVPQRGRRPDPGPVQRAASAATRRPSGAATAARALARAQHKTPAQVRQATASRPSSSCYAEFAKNVLAARRSSTGSRSAPAAQRPAASSRSSSSTTPRARACRRRASPTSSPNKSSALIQVRFAPGPQRGAARPRRSTLVRQAVAMPDWRLPNGKGTYVVTGAPVVVSDLTQLDQPLARSCCSSAALVVMALTLALVFRARLRLLPLVVALAAAGLTFGALSLAGRVADDGLDRGAAGAHRPRRRLRDPAAVARAGGAGGRATASRRPCARTAQRGAPTVATAAAATAAGFLVLALSPVPMVRGFGLLLVAGIALALGCALTLGRGRARRRGAAPRPRRAGVAGACAPRRCARRAASCSSPTARRSRVRRARRARPGAARCAWRPAHPGRVVLRRRSCVAVAGWGARHADPRRVRRPASSCPRTCRRSHDLQALQRSTGVGGEIDVVVSGRRPHRPRGRRRGWRATRRRVLKRFGYCDEARLRQGRAVPGVLAARPLPTAAPNATRQQIEGLLDAVPAVLLAGRHHPRPAHGDAGLRHPAHAAGPPAARCSTRMRDAPAPAGRRRRRARRAAGAGGRGQRGGLLAVAAAGDAARRPGRRRARAARRLPRLAARARAAAPDRAGDGLVGARALRAADPAEPDVGRRSARWSSRSRPSSACCWPSATGPSAPAGHEPARRWSAPTARPARRCWPRA